MPHFLFATDYTTPAERAFGQAAFLADRLGAELHLLHIALPLNPIQGEPHRYEVPGQELQVVEERADSAPDGILAYAERIDADLIVMGTHGYRGLHRLSHASVAEQVVRRASCPVLTVAQRVEEPGPSGIRRLLVPIDFSGHSIAALRHAAVLAEAYGAAVDLLHVMPVPVLPDAIGFGLAWPVYGADLTGDCLDSLRTLADAHLLPERRGDALVEVGDPAALILDAVAARSVDLLVVATHGRTGLRRFAMGSVAERVVREARCPVFTLKSFGKPLPAASADASPADAAPS